MLPMRRWAVLGVIGLFGVLLNLHAANDPPSRIASPQEKQRQLQAETEHLIRRVETMVQVLEYYRLDKSAEKRMLDEMEKTLAQVSREQMAALIAHLETAAKAPDEKLSAEEREKARTRHQEIVLSLKGLLAKYDAVKNLDQAAQRLDDLARTQVRLFLQNVQFTRELEDREGLAPEQKRVARKSVTGVKDAREQADDQLFVCRDLVELFKQIAALASKLPGEEEERYRTVEAAGKVVRVIEDLEHAARKLRNTGYPQQRAKGFRLAAELQWQAAGDLEELARALRAPQEKLTALRAARGRTQAALREQAFLMGVGPAAEAAAEPEAPRALAGFPARGRVAPRTEQLLRELAERYSLRDLADRQGWTEHNVRHTRQSLTPHVPALAERLPTLEQSLRDAQELLRRHLPETALDPQGIALDGLQDLLTELNRLIQEEEKEEADPLAALKKALAEVNKLLKEQKEVRTQTEEKQAAKKAEQLPRLASQQQSLARRTEEVSKRPMPAKTETRAALDRASRAMDSATREMKAQQGEPALKEQMQALEALAEAKQQLAEQVAEMENRRKEIAELEDAMQKLDKLEKAERMVAEAARMLAKESPPTAGKPSEKMDAKALAKKQAELTPTTRDVGKMVEKTAPEAAKRVAEAGKNMEAAKSELEKPQAKPAAMQAEQAANKLLDAQKMLAKAADERKAMELAAQAAMQPNTVNPAAAAQQLAKALEQTQQAMNQAQKAAQMNPQKAEAMKPPMGQQAPTPNLAKMQQQIADQAKKLGLEPAEMPAAKAAQSLQKGELMAAMQQQKQAMAQLQKAATQQAKVSESPMKSQDGKSKEGMGKGEGKGKGQPMPGQAQNAMQLAEAQQGLMEATQALMQSQEATQAARAALQQAQAQAPQMVQSPLQQAGQQLGQAGQQLMQGMPVQAGEAQAQAMTQMNQALQSLNAALAAMGQPGVQPGQMAQASAQPGQGMPPGDSPGMGEGQGQQPGKGQGQQPGKGQGQGQERNEGQGEGNRVADGKLNHAASEGNGVRGDGAFLHLPPRQRELIRQALSEKLPPEYSAMIQQYYLNLARGKTPAQQPPKR